MDIRLSKWQTDFLKHMDDDLVCAVTGISSGKSYVLSLWLVLQCLSNPGIRGICIAQNYKALTRVLFQELKSRCIELGVSIQEKVSDCSIQFPNGSVLFGYSAENPESLLGLTNISLLAIDEAAYVPESVYNYAKDRMRGTSISRTRLISSPVNGPVMNWFSKVSASAVTIRASALDNPFTSQQFKEELKSRYGEGSTLYRQQVLGEIFTTTSASSLLSRGDINVTCSSDIVAGDTLYAGYDASGLGCDSDILTIVSTRGMVDQVTLLETDTVAKANKIRSILCKYNVAGLCYDATGGYGSGVGDILVNTGISNVHGINFAQRPFSSSFPNARTEMYVELKERILSGFTVLEDTVDELCSTMCEIDSRGRLALVPKEVVKGILGHSPDRADSLALAVYNMSHFSSMEADKAKDIARKYLAALIR